MRCGRTSEFRRLDYQRHGHEASTTTGAWSSGPTGAVRRPRQLIDRVTCAVMEGVVTRTTCRVCGSSALDPGDGLRRPVHRRRRSPPHGERSAEPKFPLAARALRPDASTPAPAGCSSCGTPCPGSVLYELLLVPQRHQPHDDPEPARDRRPGGRRGRRPLTRRPRDRRRLQRRHAPRPLPRARRGRRLARDGPVGRDAVRRREGPRRDQRLLRLRGVQRALPRRAGADHHEHRDVLRPRGPRRVRRRHRALAGARRHLGQRVLATCRRCSR